MSLGDHLRYIRAMRGGAKPSEFYDGMAPEHIRRATEVELRYGDHSSPELVRALAQHLNVAEEELLWHRARPRKALSFYLCEVQARQSAATLTLRTGETLTGHVAWWDLGAVGLERAPGHITVVQRHHIVDWEGAGRAEAGQETTA